jgi:hypothetical protein
MGSVGGDRDAARGDPSLLRWFAVTGLPLGLLLVGYVLFEQVVLPGLQMRPIGFGGFWSYLGFLGLCYAFGFSQLYRIGWRRAMCTAPVVAALMTAAGVFLTFAGFLWGFHWGLWAFGVAWQTRLSLYHLILPAIISAPCVAGVAYALCLTWAQNLVEPVGEPLPRGWIWLHAVWGAVAGPSVFFGVLAAPGALFGQSARHVSPNAAQLDLLAAAIEHSLIPWAFGVALFLGMWILKRLQERPSSGRQA